LCGIEGKERKEVKEGEEVKDDTCDGYARGCALLGQTPAQTRVSVLPRKRAWRTCYLLFD
jgi:hypothetical protein